MASESKMTLKEAASVLGISPNASKAEINKASRQLIARYHPDAWRGKPAAEQKKAEQKFMQVNAAKKIMLDPSLAAPEAGQMPSGAQQGGGSYGQSGAQRQYGGGQQQRSGGYGNQYGGQHGGQQANQYGGGQQQGGGRPYATRQQQQRAQQQRPNYGQNVGYDGRRSSGSSYSQQTGQTGGYGGGYGNDGRFAPQQSAAQQQPVRFDSGARQPDPFEDLRSPRQGTRGGGGASSSHEKFNQSTSFASSFGQQPDPQERQIADQIRADVRRRYKQPADVVRSSASIIATLAFLACAIYVIVMTVTGTPLTSFEDIGGRLTDDALPAFAMLGVGILKLVVYDLIASYYVKRATNKYVNDGTRVGIEMAVLGTVGFVVLMGNVMVMTAFGILAGVGVLLAVIAVVVRRVSVSDAEHDTDVMMAHLMS